MSDTTTSRAVVRGRRKEAKVAYQILAKGYVFIAAVNEKLRNGFRIDNSVRKML